MENSRIIFHLKGDESVLLEAVFESKRETVKVSYSFYGVPVVRGFLYETALNNIESGNWVIVSKQSLSA